MPKIKSNRSAAKRFKFTAKGKVKMKQAFTSHLLSSKSPSRKRNLRGTAIAHKSEERKVKRMLPYG
ncbi:50S ribosomal protein L35 [Candidatus Desantisbacteria bacterium CG2_30_40_21]|uniref:Large ribosomal subunit protein bL35 n=4 Tax=unclassified Candidatus Desantisiibacteriota TaxID=3106372 RepID=A0A2M7JCR5_9BACT|nr:MAG: 50S ribosomal protein L35 [Candidatus Desantisbacteria bacterium CG2_30_40_21]PIX17143.1 MAG: 50S ribosomal protein L35 [Candidatus Desantisbacteria bacterium CG_4_8_14_3_um_filter_40_12]PIY19903.1 MAG: 50S ribosomal protein L35 [Candidatus Desantisbacteria bacterium CG_4_10_14_3_um_filter_40_18]PJB29222.1 MAG: 50S ribosomal protein L35 [Candidatus Desantisbacteria bacterium CG_4_9_14_3_um_filter_40_11]